MRWYNTIGKMIPIVRFVTVIMAAAAFTAAATDRVEFFGALKDRFTEGLWADGGMILLMGAAICTLAAIAVCILRKPHVPDTAPIEADSERGRLQSKRKKNYRFIYPMATGSTSDAAVHRK
jgi:hypothetical protein